jgi:7-cyano-7-deazaguanine reductase
MKKPGEEGFMDRLQRRSLLTVRPHPGSRHDCLVILSGRAGGTDVTVTLRYVPDRLALDADAFAAYLRVLDPGDLEALAVAVLDDAGNEAVPRWIQVTADRPLMDGALRTHAIVVEDAQPGWDNPRLLARLVLG